ncbi:hypothetical protein Taro_010527 [Colocasia esculenta]|uniref:ARM repeat superfamily protein n=1 Tax=Colocasia esculenta TaxID=4460 RepID=A0A843U7Z2_COLES|nr:hypothetical protein [Colocasia esculenta]
METQASETARLIGVLDEGVNKGLKSTLLLIKHRWIVDIARKAKFDVPSVRRVISEATENFSQEKKTGVSALLWHAMRGTSSRIHSKSEQVLWLLMDRSILGMHSDVAEGPDIAVEVVTETFQRLCEALEPAELKLPWNCILKEMQGSIVNGDLLHLNRLLSILISVIQFRKGTKICDYVSVFELVKLLIQTYVAPCNGTSETANKVLTLILCLFDVHDIANGLSPASRIVLEWAPIFQIENSRLLGFIKEIVCKDPNVVNAFKTQIISALDDLIVSSTDEVLYLLLMFFEREGKLHLCDGLFGESDAGVSKISRFFEDRLCYWVKVILDIAEESRRPSIAICASDLAVLWGILKIYPHICHLDGNPSCITNLIDALSRLLSVETGLSKTKWQSVAGASLASYQRSLAVHKAGRLELNRILKIARENKSSPQVLSAAAELLESIVRQMDGKDLCHEFPEFNVEHTADAIGLYAENLDSPHKVIRISTLRILSHFAYLDQQLSTEDERPSKKLKTEGSGHAFVDLQDVNVILLLLSIETTPLTVSMSRKIILLVSRIQMSIAAGKVSDAHIPLLFNGLIGVLHNRFSYLWPPVIECLMVLIGKHKDLVWNRLMQCFENFHLEFLSSGSQEDISVSDHPKPNGLGDYFNLSLAVHSDSTPWGTVVCLLLQTLQRIPEIAESRSRQIVPFFLKFLGYDGDDVSREEIFKCNPFNKKEWKSVLKEWLNLLRLLYNSRSLFRSQVLKNILTNRLLGDTDPEIQSKVLDCLLNWKDDFLLPYSQHLKNIINTKGLREELTTWVLSKDSLHIEEMHRGFLIPIVIRILVPKVRKLKTLASRKHASVNHRRAILCFLTQLDVNELPLFFSLLLKHLFSNTDGSSVYEGDLEGSLEKCQALPLSFLQAESALLKSLSLKKKFGFLHVVEDTFRSFDEFHIKPFLNLLLAVVIKILESCTDSITSSCDASSCTVDEEAVVLKRKRSRAEKDRKRSKEEAKDLRSLCLKIFCFALNRYECGDLYSQIWGAFFTSVKPLIDSFKQDVSGSENPSSLLLCFIAMSKKPSFISLLDNLLPTIFSILTEKTASETVLSSVLSFIENILTLDSDLECHDDSVKRVLMPQLKGLFSCLHQLFQHRKESHRKALMWPGMKEIRILKLLGRYINETLMARKFLDIMLPFFKKKDMNSDECLEGLHVIKGMLSLFDDEASREVLNVMSILLISARLDVRLLVCDILEGLSKIHRSLTFVAKLLRDLNAISATELDEIDYDTRISAYEVLGVEIFTSLGEDCTSVILSQCIYDLSSDLVLRQTASRALASFIQFAASFLSCEVKSNEEVPSDVLVSNVTVDRGVETVDTNTWTRKQILKIIKKSFLRNMGEAMNKEISVQKLLSTEVDISIQKEWIILLREMVCKLPGVPALCSIRPLTSDDAEVDFFSNVLHLQIHRRAKALSRFRSIVNAGNLSEDVNEKVFIPLFFSMLFEVKGGKGEHLRNACIESIASISGQMSWKVYSALLMRVMKYIRKMDSKPDKQKFLLRLMIAVLDTFHFYNICSSHMPHDEGGNPHTELPLVAKNSKSGVPDPDVIQHSLQKMVLPQVQGFLEMDSDRINANMSLAALKILRLLPKEIMESQLPSIIQRISNFLKSRLESMRDEARSVLAACLRELGLGFLGFIIKVLKATLKRGYEMHVLGYSINFILSKSLLCPTAGVLDSCLEELLSILENDILGNVSEEKEVGKIASKMKETRKSKSFETLKLVSQNITFRTHALKLLSPIEKHLQNHVAVKAKTKLEMMLSCIASGIETNPSVDQRELFIFVYGLLEDSVASEIPSSNKAPMTMDGKPNCDMSIRDVTSCGINSRLCSSHLISVFALGLLYNRLKNMKLDKKDEELLSMLDPFVKLLGSCLSSKYEDVLSGAFKCLIPLVRLPLPSLEVHADKIKALLFDIAQKSGNGTSPLMQSCLKLLTALLQSTNISLSNEQLHMLIQFPLFIDLQANPSHVALSLLKAIIARKLVIHEIYDLVTQVAELMVTCQVDSVRKKCSQILLQFLLDYRLSNKRLEQHLDFLLRNLSYEHPSGREAVLEMLHAILVKFPTSVVENHAQSWFLPLVVALVKDSDKNVQSMVATVIKMLLGRISPQTIHPILEYSLSWYQGENQVLWSAAAQVLGLMVDVLKKGFRIHVDNILPVAKRIMESSISMATSKEVGDAVPLWKEAYYTLVMLEKMLSQYPELYFNRSNKDLWEAICKFLLHPHAWLRGISNRILALYFSAASKSSGDKVNMENLLLLNHSKLFLLAVSFSNQLKSQLMDNTTSNLITQNLVFSICGIHSFAKQKENTSVHVLWSSLSNYEQASYLEAFELLGSKKSRDAFLLHTASEMHQVLEIANTKTNVQSLLVVPLLNRIGKLALTRGDVQMKVAFNCFRMMSSQIGPESSRDYAIQMLSPLYRVCEGFAGKVIADEIRELAAEVRDSIKGVVGVDHFVKAYNQARKISKEKRDKRKRGEKLMAVINPMQHAKRKLRISAKHSAHKKRKMAAMKMGRWRSLNRNTDMSEYKIEQDQITQINILIAERFVQVYMEYTSISPSPYHVVGRAMRGRVEGLELTHVPAHANAVPVASFEINLDPPALCSVPPINFEVGTPSASPSVAYFKL